MTLDQFYTKYNGKFVEYHSYNPLALNQCTDLANQYIVEVLGKKAIIGTDAKDFPSKAGSDYEWIPNTPDGVPSRGDLVIWKTNHIGIFLEGNKTNFVSFDQNYPTGNSSERVGHTYTNVSGWLHPKGNMDTISIPKSTFEELVGKATKLDQIKTTIGTDSATQLKQDYDDYKKSIEEKNNEIRVERERADNARKELNSLIASAAKALNTQQEITQIEAALARVTKELDELDDLKRQYAALQLESGKQTEELRAEIARLEALIKTSDSLAGATFEQLLSEFLRRIKSIMKGNNV